MYLLRKATTKPQGLKGAFIRMLTEYWTKASAMPAFQIIKKQKALLPVEVMTAVVAVPEVVVLEKMEKVDLVNSHLISITNISLFLFQVN